ncbi:MAG: bacterioferritin-associated ferredoxin [Bauldia sp.]
MILCSCNLLTKASLLQAADYLVTADPTRPVTAGRAFLACGKRPQCGSCVEMIRAMLRDVGMPVTCPEPLASVAAETDGPLLRLKPVEEPV